MVCNANTVDVHAQQVSIFCLYPQRPDDDNSDDSSNSKYVFFFTPPDDDSSDDGHQR